VPAIRGALAAGLLPWPQTRLRLALLLAASLAVHMAAVAALPRLMSGVSPGHSAHPARVIRVSLRPAAAPDVPSPLPTQAGPPASSTPASLATLAVPSRPSASATAGGTPTAAAASVPPTATPPATPPASLAAPVPQPVAPAVASTSASTGPVTSPAPVAGPPARAPVADPIPRQGSELAPRDATGPLAGPRYLSLKEVDQRPAPITRIEPAYPPEAGQREGRVVVRLLISENGDIDLIEIVSADPPGYFERATLEAFGNARYMPALKSNYRVKSQLTFEVRFLRDDTLPSPDRLPPPIPTGPPKAGG